MTAYHPVHLKETVECFEELAQNTGGEVEGPEILSPNILKLVINKSPKGHKKAKYKKTLIEYTWPGALAIFWVGMAARGWQIDYYPPKEGGLDAIMKLNVPNAVTLKMM
eukprot:symbB.v1.2.028558.t1/scaffold3038.1/size64864/3